MLFPAMFKEIPSNTQTRNQKLVRGALNWQNHPKSCRYACMFVDSCFVIYIANYSKAKVNRKVGATKKERKTAVNALFFSRLYLNITLVKSEKIRDTQECKQVKHLKIDVKCFNPACFWTRLHKMDWLITRVQNFENNAIPVICGSVLQKQRQFMFWIKKNWGFSEA